MTAPVPIAAPPAPADEPSPLFKFLSERPRPSRAVPFPHKGDAGDEHTIVIRPLTHLEQMVCATAAEQVAKKHLKDGQKGEIGYERLFSDAFMLEVLFRACRRHPDPINPAFPTPEKLREHLLASEVEALFQHYLTVAHELGPFAHALPDDELEQWIDRIAADGSTFAFDLLPRELQRELMLYAVYQLRPTSPTTTAQS